MNNINNLISKIGVTNPGGSSLTPGKLYHDNPFVKAPSFRGNTQLRVDKILKAFDVRNKKGLDLGCAAGGITFRLQTAGAKMDGFDYDEANINFLNAMEDQHKTCAKFYHKVINNELLYGLPEFDFIVWFDQWMWLLKQVGFNDACEALSIVSDKTNCLFFSTDQNQAMARNEKISSSDDVFKLLMDNTDFQVDDLGTVNDGWFPRNIFRCYR